MIKINFTEPTTPEWADWKQRCAEAAAELQAAYASGEQLKFKSKLYSEIKPELKKQFHGKCAYCEALLTTDQHIDVEHFRPKGDVTDLHHEPVMIQTANGAAKPHPGYYWLAYSWENLLPSCVLCNQPSSQGSEKHGKRTRFPVVPPHAARPEDVTAEQALLLNPMWQDPAPHFKFDPDTGRIIGLTDAGKTCVEVFNLNERDGLLGARRGVYLSAFLQSKSALEARVEGNLQTHQKYRSLLALYQTGEAEYALAGRQAIADYKAAIEDYLKM